MATVLRSKPLGRDASAAVSTAGWAIDIRADSWAGRTPRQVEVTSDVLAFVGVGTAASPPAPTTTNSAYHEAASTMLYTMGGDRERDLYFYVWAVSGTAEVRVSLFW